MKLNIFKIPKDRVKDLKDKFKSPSLGLKIINSQKIEIYHKKNPLALVVKGTVFTIRLNIIKMTDSQFGFGKKNIWKRDEQ